MPRPSVRIVPRLVCRAFTVATAAGPDRPATADAVTAPSASTAPRAMRRRERVFMPVDTGRRRERICEAATALLVPLVGGLLLVTRVLRARIGLDVLGRELLGLVLGHARVLRRSRVP